MWVSRLRVNGGFLSGLDVSFDEGLNVIVGPRGAGKTTMLELIRHAIGAEHADKQGGPGRNAFLAAVLGSGDVILDLQDTGGGFQVIVDAKGNGRRPDIAQSVMVLGQSELEDIASDPASRLRLLDLRAGASEYKPDRGHIGALTSQMYEVRKQLEYSREEAAKRSGLEADREIYRSQEASIIGESASPLASQRDSLKATEEQSSEVARTRDSLARALEISEGFRGSIAAAHDHAIRLHSLLKENPENLSKLGSSVQKIDGYTRDLLDSINELDHNIGLELEIARVRENSLKEAAAPLRAKLEEAEAGLGQLTAQIRNIDSQLRELDAIDVRMAVLEHQLEVFRADREAAYAAIEEEEESLFKVRGAVAEATSQQVSNHIVVIVQHLSDTSELRNLLLDVLKGSRTRTALIDALAARLLPRLLLEMVEAQDVDALASAGDISPDQASRVVGALDSSEALVRLSKVALLDSVDFLLRDGALDKSVDTLSTGQKCAVTLPIVLSERTRTLILDQPEDHLDNKYLVDHVVSGMGRRTADSVQTIVATHNANIPVLGSAGKVIVLASDGQRGHVSTTGAFDDSKIVDSITSLMEGGREAFARRSEFYNAHGTGH